MVFGYQSTRHPLHQLRDEMDRLLTGIVGPAADGLWPAVFRGQPAVNVWEKDDALIVEMEVPGTKSDEVDVSVAGGELSIRINRPDTAEEDVKYHRRERPVGSPPIPASLGPNLLTLRLPSRSASARPRKARSSPPPS